MVEENMLSDADKLKEILDKTSKENSKVYESSQPMPEIPTIMSKDQADAINEINEKSIKKQIKKKVQDDEISEMKKQMNRMEQMISKMSGNVLTPSIKAPNVDDEGYVDFTIGRARHEKTIINMPIKMANAVNSPKIAEIPQKIPVLPIKNDAKSPKIAEIPQKSLYNQQMKQLFKRTVFWVGSFVSLVVVLLILKTLMNTNYFSAFCISFLFNGVIFGVLYLTKIRNPNQERNNAKNSIQYNNLEMSEIKNCPKCNSKIDKSKVIKKQDGYSQHFKCRNVACDFQKTVEYNNEHGY